MQAKTQHVGHQNNVERQIDQVGHPHGDHAGLGPVQAFKEELGRDRDQIEGHGQGEDHQDGRSALAQPVFQTHVAQTQGPQQHQGDHRDDADLQRIDHAAPQDRADLLLAALSQQARGHDLHTHHQADRRGQHDRGRRPGQGVVGQFAAGVVANDDGVGQAHRHDAQTRHDDRPGQLQQLGQCFAGLEAEQGVGHGSRDRPRARPKVNTCGLKPRKGHHAPSSRSSRARSSGRSVASATDRSGGASLGSK
ncbi:hypothetical protein D3C80_1042330 [compost metagenome]